MRGKVLSYGGSGATPVRNRMGGSLLSNSAATNPVGGLGNSYSLLRSGIPSASNSSISSPRAGSFSIANEGMSITGKGSSSSYAGSHRGANSSVAASNVGIAAGAGQESLTPLSVLPRYDLEPLSDEIPVDGIIFARIRNAPDSLVVFRTPEERLRNPERLNLDRRQLIKCPILEQEQRLRLLNYQNNQIQVIENLENLPNLIFLDFYNNKLTSLSGPLPAVRGLRVLMAGKNKISSISNLQHLKKLDVLDLHSNDISTIENLEDLHELRVLNLAGNKISLVSKLSSLTSLTELNLRRNQITTVTGLDQLPALQRIFLSHNQLATFQDAACIFQVKHLIELSLDGNPLAEDAQATAGDLSPNGTTNVSEPHLRYRQQVICKIATLKHLDLKRVTDEERAAATASTMGPGATLRAGPSGLAGSGADGKAAAGNVSGLVGLVDRTSGADFDLSSLTKVPPLQDANGSLPTTEGASNAVPPASTSASVEPTARDSDEAGSSPRSQRGARADDAKTDAVGVNADAAAPTSSGSVGNGIALLAKKGQLPKGMSHIDIEVLSSSAAYHQNPALSGGKALVCVGDAWDWSHLLLAPSSGVNGSGSSAISNGAAINASSVPATVKRLLAPVTEIVLVHASRDISLHRLFSNSPSFLMQSFPQLQSVSVVHGPDIVRVADLDPIVALFQQVETLRHMAITGDQTPLLAAGNGQDESVRSYVVAQIPRLIRFNDRDVSDAERQAAAHRWLPLLQLRKAASATQSSGASANNVTSSGGAPATAAATLTSPTAASGKRSTLGGLSSAVGGRLGYSGAAGGGGGGGSSASSNVLSPSPKHRATSAVRSGSVFVAPSGSKASGTRSFHQLVQQLYDKQQQLQSSATAAPANPSGGALTARARPQSSLGVVAHHQLNTASMDRDAFNADIDQEVRQCVIQALRALQQQHPHLYGAPPTAAQIAPAGFTSNL